MKFFQFSQSLTVDIELPGPQRPTSRWLNEPPAPGHKLL